MGLHAAHADASGRGRTSSFPRLRKAKSKRHLPKNQRNGLTAIRASIHAFPSIWGDYNAAGGSARHGGQADFYIKRLAMTTSPSCGVEV